MAILASIATTRFVDLSCKATVIQEKTTIAALKSAILLGHAENILNGVQNPWPDVALFGLLDNAPPYEEVLDQAPPGCPNASGVWTLNHTPVSKRWIISCPSYCVQACAGCPSSRGDAWYYYYDGPGAGSLTHTTASPGHGCP